MLLLHPSQLLLLSVLAFFICLGRLMPRDPHLCLFTAWWLHRALGCVIGTALGRAVLLPIPSRLLTPVAHHVTR